ncbi:hypothetical protein ACFL5O_01605 [Myxococcota bacterium]
MPFGLTPRYPSLMDLHPIPMQLRLEHPLVPELAGNAAMTINFREFETASGLSGSATCARASAYGTQRGALGRESSPRLDLHVRLAVALRYTFTPAAEPRHLSRIMLGGGASRCSAAPVVG